MNISDYLVYFQISGYEDVKKLVKNMLFYLIYNNINQYFTMIRKKCDNAKKL